MIRFTSTKVVAVGEAMIEMSPTGDGLFRLGFAGDTFNTLWQVAQLVGDRGRAGMVTRLGTDALSSRFVAEMETDGLDLSGIARDPARTMGLYLIELDGVERSFHYWRKDSAARHLADDPALLAAYLLGAGLIHVSGITLAILTPETRQNLLQALVDARRAGAILCFDPNYRPRLWASPGDTRDAVSQILAITDIALPSFDDEAALWGDATPAETIARLASQGVKEIVVKNGASPMHVLTDAGEDICGVPPVSGIRDTSGAGDGFNAGYLAARFLGAAPEQAIMAGQRVSAEVIRTFGARADREAIRALAQKIMP
ncbi:MAG: sugar kinase [Hyphomicrobiaceae bacterium]|nr:sugar kinase [Hyphomicrobiaceae bacterium]